MTDVTFKQVEKLVVEFLEHVHAKLQIEYVLGDAIVGHIITELSLPDTKEYASLFQDTLDIMAQDGKLARRRQPLGLCFKLL